MTAEPVVTTSTGRLRGRSANGVTAFLGVPYAAAPTGQRRFRAPEPVAGWAGVLDATRVGAAAPQPPSRLEAALGSMGITAQDEDCLSLNIWTPQNADGPLPVLVWLHGGAFVAGSGGQPWYDGALLAAGAQAVVVTVNYRLGALGFLSVPGTEDAPPAANLGLLDQAVALRWVHDNAAAFGGDPGEVAFGGQSAGSQSALALLHSPDTAALVRRAVLQSAPLGLPPLTLDEAAQRTELLLAALELAPTDVRGLRAVPVDRLLDAQNTVSRQLAVPLQIGPAYQLVADGVVMPPDLLVAPAAAAGVDVLIGATDHEGDAFCVPNPQVQAMTRADVEAALVPLLGDGTTALYEQRRADDPDAPPSRVAADLVTHHYFHRDIEPLTSTLRDNGNATTTYSFGWYPEGNPLRSCHCMDLPFVFGNLDAWRGAPLLAGADDEDMAKVVVQAQSALRDFLHG
jgi:para-nitrobenzyl esterase